jgi:hypothetical protein
MRKPNDNKKRFASNRTNQKKDPKFTNKGRKPSDSKKEDEEVRTYGSNDISWYTVDKQLVEDAGKVAFVNAIGSVYNTYVDGSGTTKGVTMPSLMSIHFMPTIGYTAPGMPGTNGRTAPVNVMARAMQSHIQKTVSTKLPFNAADLAIHIAAMDSIYLILAWAQRICGLWSSYMVYNRTIPYVYFESFGLDWSTYDRDMSMPEFRAKINRLAVDLSRLFIPKEMKVCLRHSWLASKVFTDSLSDKAQQYIFNPSGFWKFTIDESAMTKENLKLYKARKSAVNRSAVSSVSTDAALLTTGAGMLEWVDLPNFQDTGLAGIYAFIESLLSEYYTDIDTWTINGYIARAYGEHGVFKIGLIDENYRVEPEYDETILMQIHNMTVCGNVTTTSGYRPTIIQEVDDSLTCKIYLNSAHAVPCMSKRLLMDMPMAVPTAEQMIEATRLKSVGHLWNVVGTEDLLTYMQFFGTEIVNSITIYDEDTTTRTHCALWGSLDSQSGLPTFSYSTVMFIAKVAPFHAAPIFYITNESLGTSARPLLNTEWIKPIGEIENYTCISEFQLQMMHDAAVMGEFYIPEISVRY